MNPLTNVKNVKKLSEAELKGRNKTSWHDQYRGSAWLFIGGLPYDLTEGDIVCVFSQYGEPVNINLVRDKDSGKSKGYCFLCYEDQRSTDLAVDNLNGIKLLSRTLRVDHVNNYRPPKERKEDDEDTKTLKREGLAGLAIRTIKKEEVSTVKVEVKKEVPSKKHVKVEKESSESDSDSDLEDSRVKHKKKLKKKKIIEKKRKKKKRAPSSSSEDSSESSSHSSDSDSKPVKMRKGSSSYSSSSSDSSQDHKPKKLKHHKDVSEKEIYSKKDSKKHSKTIDELKREARLIQEELLRRQKAKNGDDGRQLSKPKEELRKRQESPPDRQNSRRSPINHSELDKHDRHRKRSRSFEKSRVRRSNSPDRSREVRHRRWRSRSNERFARRSRSNERRRERFLGRDMRMERGRDRDRVRSPPRRGWR